MALEFENNGWEINSADQSELEISNNQVCLVAGSSYMKHNNTFRILDNTTKRVKIEKVLLLYGLCDDGTYSKQTISDFNYKMRRIWNFVSWVCNTPIITTDSVLYDNSLSKQMYPMCKKICEIIPNIDIIRGDKRIVVKQMESELKVCDRDNER